MTKEQAKFFVNASEYCGNQDIELRENYSGRGMFGFETCGVVVNNLTQLMCDAIQYVKETALDGNVEVLEKIPDFQGFRTDNMAMDTIIY